MPIPTLPTWSRLGRKPEVRRLTRLADAARDARNWAEAIQHYTAAIALAPERPGLWVQLGNCQKEAGQFDSAEAAYLRADALRPGDADLHVQMGHLAKLRGNVETALDYYRRAYALGSTDVHAREAAGAGGETTSIAPGANAARVLAEIAARAQTTTTLYLDVSDLLLYFRNNRFPTGIQRVQIELYKASLEWKGDCDIRTVVMSHNPQFWADIDPIGFRRLCNLASMPGRKDDPEWRDAVREFIEKFERQPAARLPRGAILMNIGTSWWMPNYMQILREAKARLGILYVPLVFDLVPMLLPEYLDGDFGPVFCFWLSSMCLHADATMAISENTGRDLAKAAQSVRTLRHRPVVARMDAATHYGPSSLPSAAAISQVLEKFSLPNGGYVLFLGTLEARKNHLLVFQCWLRLLQTEPRENVPILLCVGKKGWRFEASDHFLRSHPDLADKVVMLSGVSDRELQSLFAGCLFTVYNSVYEGWGLPVTESLNFGKACLTPNHSSLPEAGGDFADYYDGASIDSLVAQARRLIFDPAYRAGREARIARDYRPRGWDAVLQGMVAAVLPQIEATPPPESCYAPIDWNIVYPLMLLPELRGPDRVAALGEMLRAGNSWHELDGWGVWAKRQRAELAFLVPDPGGSESDAIILMRMHLADPEIGASISTGGVRLATLEPGAALTRLVHVTVPFHILADRRRRNQPLILACHVDRMIEAPVHGEDKPVGIGITSFAICRADDIDARLGLLEQAVLTVFAGSE
jgi:glycosyltransferase involved in cell wall biosynthesis